MEIDSRLTHIMIIDGGYWSKGKDLTEAKKAFEKLTGRTPTETALKYAVTADARCDDHGRIGMPKRNFVEPVLL